MNEIDLDLHLDDELPVTASRDSEFTIKGILIRLPALALIMFVAALSFAPLIFPDARTIQPVDTIKVSTNASVPNNISEPSSIAIPVILIDTHYDEIIGRIEALNSTVSLLHELASTSPGSSEVEQSLSRLEEIVSALTQKVTVFEEGLGGVLQKQEELHSAVHVEQDETPTISEDQLDTIESTLSDLHDKVSDLESTQAEVQAEIERELERARELDEEWEEARATEVEAARGREEELLEAVRVAERRLGRIEARFRELQLADSLLTEESLAEMVDEAVTELWEREYYQIAEAAAEKAATGEAAAAFEMTCAAQLEAQAQAMAVVPPPEPPAVIAAKDEQPPGKAASCCGFNEGQPDYALLRAGARVLHSETSATYYPDSHRLDRLVGDLAATVGLVDADPLSLSPSLSSVPLKKSPFASLSARAQGLGGWIRTYVPRVNVMEPLHRLGIDTGVGRPEDVLSSDLSLGACWPMNGTEGTITIQLGRAIILESITIDHVSRENAVDLRSAPKQFLVFASPTKQDEDYRLVVRGTYNISGDSPASQNYPTEPSSRAAQQGADPSSQSQPQQPYQQPVQFVSVRILSNHGHDKYTCLYRIRAHGRPAAV